MIGKVVEVTFSLFIEGDIKLNERKINTEFDIYRSRLYDPSCHYIGVVIISYPDQPIVEAEDDLPALVQNLCFVPIPDLIANKNIFITHFDHDGCINLNPRPANIIMISGNDIPTIHVPHKELTLALYECGQRFIQFLISLKGETDDSDLENLIYYLKDKGEIARKALESMKFIEHEKQD